MRIIPESPAEAELLSRRLPALRHALGPAVVIDAPGISCTPADALERLRQALGPAVAAADLERAWRRPG